MSNALIIYLAVVGGITLLVFARLLFWLKAAEIRNRRRFRKQAGQQPVETASPIDDPKAENKEQVLAALEERFSVTRKLLVPIVLLVAGFALVVPFLDMVPAASVSLLVGAITVVAGLALRPVVENAIAGLVISSSKLITVGDTLLIEKHYGTVEDITITHTTIKLWDWRRYILSNTKMLQIEFANYSLFDSFVWAYAEFWVDYAADLDEVERMVVEAGTASEAYAGYEPPRMWLMETGPDAVKCWAAAWADSPPDAWQLKHDMRKSLITALAERGWAPRRHRIEGEVPSPPNPMPGQASSGASPVS